MSVKAGERGIIPNWIKENDWSAESRILWANTIMATSPRDWSCNIETLKHPDPELWALWCLITSDTKEEALESWWNFCDENS